MFNDVLYLIKENKTFDELTGDETVSYTENLVFCHTKSIGQSEFYQAQSAGYKPEIKFVIADFRDYDDETMIRYNNKEYEIIRTYRSNDNTELEIVVQRRVNKNERA